MKKILTIIILTLCMVLMPTAIACNASSSKTTLTAKQIVNKLVKEKLPIGTIVVYTEKTDTNKLLGRPNEYTSKANFADKRIEQTDKNDPVGGTIEVFNNSKDAKARYEYIKKLTKDSPMLKQYMYLHKNVLMRIEYDLTPSQAKKYDKALAKIIK